MTQAFGQGNTLYNVSMVMPKIGQAAAFEAAWKAHVAKFHQGDNKRTVYEILSGDHAGMYQLVDGPSSFADMDKENPKRVAHDLDYNTNVAPKLASESGSYVYRWVDTLSYHGDVKADKYSTTVYNVKLNKMPELIAELKRSMAVNASINSPASSNVFLKQMAGSEPQMVFISNLKDGFKQLDNNYFPGLADKFKEAYIKMYSQAQWDKRLTLLSEITNSYETYISRRRDDLSSK
jgi:hypothetical protein